MRDSDTRPLIQSHSREDEETIVSVREETIVSVREETIVSVREENVQDTDQQENDLEKPDGEDREDHEGGEDREDLEGGYGWVVVAASFLCNMVLDGVAYSFGILLQPIKEDFQDGSGSISLVGSILAGSILLSGPISAACSNRFGSRLTCVLGAVVSSIGILGSSFVNTLPLLIISYGVVGGFGLGLMYVPSVVSVAHYFNKRLSLATGICVCGSGAGTFAFAPLVAELVRLYGWRGCNRVIAGLCLLCTLLGLLMVPPKEPLSLNQTTLPKVKKTFDIGVLRNGRFLLVLLGNVPVVMASYSVYTYLPNMANSAGLPTHQASYLISAIGMTNTLGRLLCGWLTDLPHIHPVLFTMVGLVSAGLLPSLMTLCSSYHSFLVAAALFGLLFSPVTTATSAVIVQLLGKPHLNCAFGILTFVRGIAALVGPPVSGAILDRTGAHNISFYVSSGFFMFSGILHGLVYLLDRRHERCTPQTSCCEDSVHSSTADSVHSSTADCVHSCTADCVQSSTHN